MPSPTAAELIRQAYCLAQIWDPGEEQPGVQANEGLLTLNTIISEWSSVGTLIPAYKTLSISLVQGDFLKTQSPPITDLIESNLVDSSGDLLTVLEEINLQRFNTLNFNFVQDRPKLIYIEAKTANIQTTTNVYFYPPASGTFTVSLKVKQVISEFEYEDEMTVLPLNYFKALKYQLAKDLADIYLTTLSARFDKEYDAAMARLKGVNRKDLSVQNSNPFYERRRYRPWNIYAG